MNQAKRWKRFLEWWREIEDKSDLYPPSNLAQMIRIKIKELQKGTPNHKAENKHDNILTDWLAEAGESYKQANDQLLAVNTVLKAKLVRLTVERVDKILQAYVLGKPSPLTGINLEVHDTRREVAEEIARGMVIISVTKGRR